MSTKPQKVPKGCLTGDDFHNPELTGPRVSHNIPNGGLYSVYASAKINAPPQVVYDALLDVWEWKEWNKFVYEVKITKNPNVHDRQSGSHKRITGGTCMVFKRNLTFDPPEQTESRQVVTLVERLKLSTEGHSSPCITRVRWRLDNAAASTPSFMLKAERINEIIEEHDGTTTYRTWEVFAGPVAKYMRKKFEKPWRDRMQESTQDFKKWCEKKYAEGGLPKKESVNGETAGKSEGGKTKESVSEGA